MKKVYIVTNNKLVTISNHRARAQLAMLVSKQPRRIQWGNMLGVLIVTLLAIIGMLGM